MKRLFVASALCLLASAGAASAGGVVVSLDGYCNAYDIRAAKGLSAIKDTGCSNGFGGGVVGSVKGFGKAVIVGLQDPGNSSVQFVFEFSYPLTNGGSWTLYSNNDGVHTSLVLSGTYSLATPGEIESKGTKSVTAR
jgi:hypothetical protein